MTAGKRLTWKAWIGTNLVLAFVFANLLAFGPGLQLGDAFLAGLLTGIGASWTAFAALGYAALRRGGRDFDERRQTAVRNAAATSFWILLLASCVASILLRSRTLALEIEARDLSAILGNIGLVGFGTAWAVAERAS